MTLSVILGVEVMADSRGKAPEARYYMSQLESAKYIE